MDDTDFFLAYTQNFNSGKIFKKKINYQLVNMFKA